jgi:uncharacterized membrane protein
MLWSLIAQVVTVVLDVLSLRYTQDTDKDLELLVLRQQIRILERRVGKPVRASRVEKLMLVVVALQFKQRAQAGRKRFLQTVLIFKPASVLKWHRELAKRKWTFQRQANVGKPRIQPVLEALIVRLARRESALGLREIAG